MLLESLKGEVRIEHRVRVIQPDDEARPRARRRACVDESAAELVEPQGVSQRVHDGARRQPARRQLPELLQAQRVDLRKAPRSSRCLTSVFVRLPRTPSQKIVTFARTSTPG